MKTKFFTILSICLSTSLIKAQGIGVNETGASPDPSAVLDVSSSNKGVLAPRMTTAERNAIANPASGLVIFNTTLKCIEVNNGSPSSPVWDCLQSSNQNVSFNCNANGFQGSFIQNTNTSGRSFSVTITNNSFAAVTLNFAAADLILSGVGGMTVGTPTGLPALTSGNITLNAGQNVVVTYPISGFPNSFGTLTGTWTKASLTCTKDIDVAENYSNVDVSCSTADRGFSGIYFPGQSATFSGATSFRVRVTNNGSSSIQLTPLVGDLTLSGASGLNITSVNPSTVQTIAAGGFVNIDYILGGTVPNAGVVTATYNKVNLNCSNSLILDNPPALGSSSVMLTECSLPASNPGGSYSSWLSSNTSILTVNGTTGLITATTTPGTANITGLRTGTNYRLGFSVTSINKIVIVDANGVINDVTGNQAIPAGVPSFEARVWGGGGAGCGIANPIPNNVLRSGIGGNGGAFSQKLYTTAPGQNTISFTAGKGGLGSNSAGENGANSTVTYDGITITGQGGLGGPSFVTGTSQSQSNSSGGSASGGDVNTSGQVGFASTSGFTTFGYTTLSRGGSSPNGGATKEITDTSFGLSNVAINGAIGNAPGGGGTGFLLNCSTCTGLARVGGNGAAGRIRLNFTCPTN